MECLINSRALPLQLSLLLSPGRGLERRPSPPTPLSSFTHLSPAEPPAGGLERGCPVCGVSPRVGGHRLGAWAGPDRCPRPPLPCLPSAVHRGLEETEVLRRGWLPPPGRHQEGHHSHLVLVVGRLPPATSWGGCLPPCHGGPSVNHTTHPCLLPQLAGCQVCRCRLPPTIFGNGRTHTGEVMGSGGSRLANYGARARPATPATEGGSMLHLDLLPRWGGGGGSSPRTTGQWQRAVQLEVNSASPCAPLGHRSLNQPASCSPGTSVLLRRPGVQAEVTEWAGCRA